MRELADGSKAVAIMSTREDIPVFMSISFDQVSTHFLIGSNQQNPTSVKKFSFAYRIQKKKRL